MPTLQTRLNEASQQDQYELSQISVERTESAKILVPEGMPYALAIEAINNMRVQEETTLSIHETVNCFPLDGARALMAVLGERYGWVTAQPTPGFFGPKPPTMINLATGPGIQDEVPIIWGSFEVPNIEGRFETNYEYTDNQLIFQLAGTTKQKHLTDVHSIMNAVRAFIQQHSVYKGKAIRLSVDHLGNLNPETPPTFMDLRSFKPELVFSKDVWNQVNTSVFMPIERTALARMAGVPLKRGILLEGPYGVGKTLCARTLAWAAQKQGWTFVYLNDVKGLEQAVLFARQYLPAIVFAEDIDQVLGSEERDDETNKLLNVIDGVDSKERELMIVLTTNHIERINAAMLREGRLDAIISIQPPDADAVLSLVDMYSHGTIKPGEDITSIGEVMAGQIPATIREMVERAKLYAITRLTDEEAKNIEKSFATLEITAEDLTNSAKYLLQQRDRINTRHKEVKIHPALQLAQQRDSQLTTMEMEIEKIMDKVDDVVARIGA